MTNISPFRNQLIHGDCLSVMASLPAHSVHLIVTDPLYGVNYLHVKVGTNPATYLTEDIFF